MDANDWLRRGMRRLTLKTPRTAGGKTDPARIPGSVTRLTIAVPGKRSRGGLAGDGQRPALVHR
jgi:hypothetical protein